MAKYDDDKPMTKKDRKEQRNKFQHGQKWDKYNYSSADNVDTLFNRIKIAALKNDPHDTKIIQYTHNVPEYNRALVLSNNRKRKNYGKSKGKNETDQAVAEKAGGFYNRMDEIVEPRVKQKKKATTVAVTILALFGMYLLSLQGSVTAGYAMCLDNGNVLIGGIALIVIILLFVLINTRK
ncbi:MAG: hypothetical protein KKI14_00825, partial [Nanoarchaeota archaeon]|nr:hypothetical protein [Nanoarchaeota archaeon]